MRKKRCYLILSKKSKYLYGAFPRTKEGKALAQLYREKLQKDRKEKEAIKMALTLAQAGDIVVITGKGSETSMAVAGGRKIPWSDRALIIELLK